MTIKVGKGNIRETISAEGFIEPIHQENLNFPARTGSVKVEKIHVKKGDFVEKWAIADRTGQNRGPLDLSAEGECL